MTDIEPNEEEPELDLAKFLNLANEDYFEWINNESVIYKKEEEEDEQDV
jgi:hypothetical protein